MATFCGSFIAHGPPPSPLLLLLLQLEWSPDSRVLAVGYQRQGLTVWSPSGCRLMCRYGGREGNVTDAIVY